jgi:pimeloyl-ACP methyl ester carboxylesterase
LNTTIDGQNISYDLAGAGDYVFLLHGWGADRSLFAALASNLAERYTVVSLDFPGFGQSEEPKNAWDVGDYASFTAKFIAQFDCKKAILLGHSFGGRVIIKMTGMTGLPFEITKIILVDSAGILPQRTWKYHMRVRAYKTGKIIWNSTPMKTIFPNALEGYKKKLGSADYAKASETMRKTLVKTVNEDLEPLLKNIKAQTLLIWGENDTATPLSDGEKMKQALSEAGTDVGLVVLKGAGHYSFLDQQFTFLRVVRSFLQMAV